MVTLSTIITAAPLLGILGTVIGWIQKLLPDAPVTRTQAGHFLQEEVPDEIAAAIRWVAGKA